MRYQLRQSSVSALLILSHIPRLVKDKFKKPAPVGAQAFKSFYIRQGTWTEIVPVPWGSSLTFTVMVASPEPTILI